MRWYTAAGLSLRASPVLPQDTKVWVPDPDENVYYAAGKTVKKTGDKYTVLKDSGEVRVSPLFHQGLRLFCRFHWDRFHGDFSGADARLPCEGRIHEEPAGL